MENSSPENSYLEVVAIGPWRLRRRRLGTTSSGTTSPAGVIAGINIG